MRVTLVAALAATGVLLGACKDKKAELAQADANAAQFVPPSVTSRLDFGAAMERRFRTLDRNGDDQITKDELPSPDTRIKALDRNKDGVITAIEWSEGTLKWFDTMDLNRDGTVTSEERAESQKRRPAQ